MTEPELAHARQPEVRRPPPLGAAERVVCDADDGDQSAVHAEVAAERGRVSREQGRPKPIADDGDRRCARRVVLRRGKRAAEVHLHAEHVEVRRGDEAGIDLARGARASGHREARRLQRRQPGHRLHARRDVEEVEIRESADPESAASPDAHLEPADLVGTDDAGHGAVEQAVGQADHARRRAEAQREREHRGGNEARRAYEGTSRETRVEDERLDEAE